MLTNEKQYNTSNEKLTELQLLIAFKRTRIERNSKEEGAIYGLIRLLERIQNELILYEKIHRG